MKYTDDDFTRIMNEHGDTVLRICAVRLGNLFDAQDAFQEVFISLYNAKNKPVGPHIKPWLIRCAINECVTLMRKRKVTAPINESSAVTLPKETDSAVVSAVMSLPENQRVPIYLFYFENMSTREIAHATGKNETYVRVLLHRGREKLRGILEDETL